MLSEELKDLVDKLDNLRCEKLNIEISINTANEVIKDLLIKNEMASCLKVDFHRLRNNVRNNVY